MSTAAVVVRWRGGDEVERCLRSLLGQVALDRIVLVDSGSGDGGADRLAGSFPEIQVLALPENRSFAWAAGRGFEACDEDLLLLLNPDTELPPAAVAGLVRALDRRAAAAGVVPLLRDPDGRPQHRWQLRRLPGPARLTLGLGGAPAFGSSPREPAPVAQPAAAAWLLRRSVWLALEGLDPRFAPAWWEDVDFCARLRSRLSEADFPVSEGFWVEPGVELRHVGGSSIERLSDRDFLTAFFGNLLRYAGRHHPRRLSSIRLGLLASLRARSAVRPARREAYRHAIRKIRNQRPID
jgi:GT2 family glycosyltransferase